MTELNLHYREALEAMQVMRSQDLLCDISLVFEDKKTIMAHKVVLAASSTFFRAIFTDRMLGGTSTLKVQGASADIGELLVDFAYTAKVNLLPENLALVLEGAEKLGFPQVEKMCLEASALLKPSILPVPVSSREPEPDLSAAENFETEETENEMLNESLESQTPYVTPQLTTFSLHNTSVTIHAGAIDTPEDVSDLLETRPGEHCEPGARVPLPEQMTVEIDYEKEKPIRSYSKNLKTEAPETNASILISEPLKKRRSRVRGSSGSLHKQSVERPCEEEEDPSDAKMVKQCNFFEGKMKALLDYEKQLSPKAQEILTDWQSDPTKTQKIICAICKKVVEGSYPDFVQHVWQMHPPVDEENVEPECGEENQVATKKTRKGSFPCDECEKVYLYKHNLAVHKRYMHTEEILTCVFCKRKGFANKRNLKDHEDACEMNDRIDNIRKGITADQVTDGSIPCGKCDSIFPDRETLKKHWFRIHKRLSKEACKQCGKEINKFHMANHVRTVHLGLREEPQPCPDCGKLYIKGAMRIHRKRDHMGLRYKCPECPESESETKIFTTKIMLRRHREAVHQKRRFRCTICQAEFVDKSSWRSHHEVVHEGRRYPCNQCKKEFTRPSDRKQHVAEVHEGKRWNCTYCPKSYTQNSNLRLHIRTTHMGIFQHKCSVCEKGFLRPVTLREHMLKDHQIHMVTTDVKDGLLVLRNAT